jgi:Flp pilus assembly protein TadG
VTGILRRDKRRDEGGASAVEFALVLPVLIMLVFGAIQYGLYFWSMQGGSSAVREAARRGAVGQLVTCTEFRNYVKDRLGSTATDVTLSDIKRTYATAAGTPVTDKNLVAAGDVVTVQVKFTAYDLRLPLIPNIGNGRVDQSADSRVEYAPLPAPEICS